MEVSNLKHQTPDQLRMLISWCVRVRDGHEASWKAKEAQIEELQQQIAEHRRLHHNIGQKECWARIYLARSE